MRRAVFGLGLALLLVAGALAVAALLSLLFGGGPGQMSLGSIWYGLHPNSLIGFQGIIEKHLDPALWPPVQTVISAPAWLTLALPGVLLALLARPRPRRFG